MRKPRSEKGKSWEISPLELPVHAAIDTNYRQAWSLEIQCSRASLNL